MSAVGQPVGPVAPQPPPNPGGGRGWAPARAPRAPVNEARPALSCPPPWPPATTTHCLASALALRCRSRTKFRTGFDWARCRPTASRSCHRSGCGCSRPTTPPRACWRTMKPANFFGRGRPPREPPIRIGPAWSASSHDRRPHVHIAEANAGDLAPVDLAPVGIPSARRPHERARLQPPVVPTEIQPRN
jgi:hypothetical protein